MVPRALRAVPDALRAFQKVSSFRKFQEVSFALTRVPKILKKIKKAALS